MENKIHFNHCQGQFLSRENLKLRFQKILHYHLQAHLNENKMRHKGILHPTIVTNIFT